MKTFANILSKAIGASLLIPIKTLCINVIINNKPLLNDFVSNLIAVVMSALIAFLVEYFMLKLPKFKCVRFVFSSFCREFEGEWLEILLDRPDAPYAYCYITSKDGENYKFTGKNYMKCEKDDKSFICDYVKIENHGFSYVDRDTVGFTKCWGIYYPIGGRNSEMSCAKGYFIDMQEDNNNNLKSTECKVEMVKINRKFYKQIEPESHEELAVIRAYHKKHGENKGIIFNR